ncbi:hypothetical protein ACUW9N_001472 [Staphylococcus auricularis]|nr:hypothetical protein [Staphylococcus auricularis]MCG7342267.1 hypothetical protein [Staphylococcus auricularis]MDC6327109.1 hypothetical protein [Staphylococcus auricularis]BCU53368.1 hypothetical protein JCM2421_21400 [Staphylococcus auricularis]SQJ17296.1 Uncharacterised protein [Staphylococcus auricularis]
MQKNDAKTLKVTFSGLATFLFFISGLYFIALFWFILTVVFAGQNTTTNK